MLTPVLPSEAGARAEAEIVAALVRLGKSVFLPAFAGHSRTDLVFVDDLGAHRVQCKTARRVGDALFFRTSSNTNNSPRGYRGEVDYFGVYSPELGATYLIPAGDVPDRVAHLRLLPARNGQKKRIRVADAYRIAP